MIVEEILVLVAIIIAIGLIGVPVYKLIKEVLPKRTNPIKEAKVRLEVAKQELEAARLNKETDKLYEQMYSETLEDLEESNRNKL